MSLRDLDLDSRLKIFLGSRNLSQIKELIREYNDECKAEDKKEKMIKGYSKFKKAELIDFLINALDEEYKEKLLKRIEKRCIEDLFNQGLALLKGKGAPEKLKKAEEFEGLESGYNFIFEGFSWQTETDLILTDDNMIDDFRCDCRYAQSGGLCQHFFAGLIYLIKNNIVDPESLGVFFIIDKDKLDKIDDAEIKLKREESDEEYEYKIENEPSIEEVAMSNEKGNVGIKDGIVTFIEERKSYYQDKENVWYLLKLENGMCYDPTDKEAELIPFERILARISKRLKEENDIKEGDKVSLKGTLQDSKYYGLMLKNIRKIIKSS
ncbi:MAG: hypothetical protein ACTSPQ_15350 [Candidatus Helarchaeota archaeon]